MVPSDGRTAVLRWLAGGILALAAIGFGLTLGRRESPPPSPVERAALVPPRPAQSGAAKAGASGANTPSFDIVRIAPDGSVVIAGRAAPGADVTVFDAGKPIGHVKADAQGQFVLLPTEKLPAGASQLTLSARPPGGIDVTGTGSVVLNLPPAAPGIGSAAPAPLAVLVGPGAAPRPLQGAGTAVPGQLGLAALDYDQHGAARFDGTAPPGARVRILMDGRVLGEAVAGADGRWSLDPSQPIGPGRHVLRLDRLGADGTVLASTDVPFQRESLAGNALAPGSVMVEPGSNLWRIARASYGSGTRYTLIFKANRNAIRNPDLIYPGQVFHVPPPAARPLEPTK